MRSVMRIISMAGCHHDRVGEPDRGDSATGLPEVQIEKDLEKGFDYRQ